MIKSSKLVLSGAVLELFNFHSTDFVSEIPLFEADEAKRARSLRRASRTLRRSINANSGQWYDENTQRYYIPLFLTLTFAENVQGVLEANKEFSRFVKKLNYFFHKTSKRVVKYTNVIEFQKRGAVHYHTILYNIPYVEDIKDILSSVWGHGFIKVNSIKDVRNVGAYVVKYMSKDITDERLRGKKTYFQSRGLLKPLVIREDARIARILEDVPDTLIGRVTLGTTEYYKFYIGNSFLRLLNTSRSYPQVIPSPTVIQGILPLDADL